jgi:putative transposase
MTPFFTPSTVKTAFQSRFHFAWCAYKGQEKLASLRPVIEKTFLQVAERRNYHVLENEVEPRVFRALLSLAPQDSPAEVTRYVKGNIATAARNERGVAELWSRGWFVRSVGTVTTDTVRVYVAGQYERHGAAPGKLPDAAAKAGYRHRSDATVLRTSNHARFECNAHIVFVTCRRREFLDLHIAEALVDYWRRVCAKKHWIPWNINVVWNHAHVFLGLSPVDAPGDAALSLLNNAEHFLGTRYCAALRDEVDQTVWQPGFYVGTAGSATTAQVKAFLASGVDRLG